MSDNKGVIDVVIDDQLKQSYLSYAMSVICSRAIPDVRDGLKPVQRRILYAMYENGLYYNKPHRKSARVVGEVIGKYHPHGDTAIYDALVRMAQDFSMGTVLVNGQGNFGSIDNDPPAAMRYTEAKLMKITQTMLQDIDKDTVFFKDNYDGSEKEPSILPASYPNILANGSDGIAVGMATNIPPHNLGEVINCAIALIENPNLSDAEVVKILPAPDFPTGGIIMDGKAAAIAIERGRGSIKIRGKAHFEKSKGSKEIIVITELPYQLVKTRLIEKISQLVKEKRLENISNIRDESNKKGIRLCIELKKDASPEVVLNHLYKYTPLQGSFAVNALSLNNNKPEIMGVKKMLLTFLDFRKGVIVNRFSYELQKLRSRAHLAIGLRVTVDSIDEIIAIIRGSKDQQEARNKLLSKNWPVNDKITTLIGLVGDYRNKIEDGAFSFTEEQVRGILEMKLSKLTGLERQKISDELESLAKSIDNILSILRSDEKIMMIMSDELAKIRDEFAIPRRTEIQFNNGLDQIDDMDLIEREKVIITITTNGYIKRVPAKNYTAQRRGGKGRIGVTTNEDDDVLHVLISDTHSDILLFSDLGKVYKIKAYKIPSSGPQAKGRAIINLIPLKQGENITNFMSLPCKHEENQCSYLMFSTKKGKIRKSSIDDFRNINENGKIAISLDDSMDRLISVLPANDSDNYLIATKKGKALRCTVESLRVIKSRNSSGVMGISLEKSDEVVSFCILHGINEDIALRQKYLSINVKSRILFSDAIKHDNISLVNKYCEKFVKDTGLEEETLLKLAESEQFLLTINENGFGKRTSAYEYRITNRGGKGILNMDISRGNIVNTFVADNNDDIVIGDTKGKMIRCVAKEISIIGRTTKGVKVFKLNDSKVISVARILDQNKSEEEVL